MQFPAFAPERLDPSSKTFFNKRAKIAEKAGIFAGENLKVAQHRDTLRRYVTPLSEEGGVSDQCEAVFSG